MLDLIYDVEPVRQFLRNADARRLDPEVDELPKSLVKKRGEHWLYPARWRHADKIIVSLGETYPDDPPLLFLPPSLCGIEILPHVAKNGDICTLERTYTIDPFRPLEVLKECLEVARANLDREWTDAELADQINQELNPYWDFIADKSLLYFESDLALGALEVVRLRSKSLIMQARALTEEKVVAPVFALTVKLGSNETVPFLRNQPSFLATSASFRQALDTFSTSIIARKGRLNSFDLIVILVTQLGNEKCVLAGILPQPIQAKRKSATQLSSSILGAIGQKPLEPMKSHDVSTRRLIQRSMGPSFKETRLTQRVAIIGCGSLGSFVADGLARAGLRLQFLCDMDSLDPGNLLRHLLPGTYLRIGKADGLAHLLRERLPDAEIIDVAEDIRTQNAQTALQAFNPDLVFFATGDTNTDITLSNLLPVSLPKAHLVFGWADFNLIAGHLVYQPPGSNSFLRELHDSVTAEYHYSLRNSRDVLLKEAGCQNSYSPYSGLAMAQFAVGVACKLLEWLDEPPNGRQVLRTQSHPSWETLN